MAILLFCSLGFYDEDYHVNQSIYYDDNCNVYFGTDNDVYIESDTAKTLEILAGASTDDYAVNIGVDQSGVDLKVFGATTGEYWSYDASADTITVNTGNAIYTMTDAEANQFKVDATGTVAGFAIVFETTTGGIQLNADGTTQGDITVDAADDLNLTAAGDIIVTVGDDFSITDDDTFSLGTDDDAAFTWDSSPGELDLVLAAGSINITLSGQADDMAGLYVNCTVPTGQQSWGGIYSDMTIAGTTDGVCAAISGIAWTSSASTPTSILCGAKVGVSDSGGALAGCTIVGLYVETTLDAAGSDPAAHYMMRFNTSQGAETPTHWFQAANPESVAFVASTTHTSASTDKIGAIKIAIVGYGDCYLYVYDHQGQ